MNANLNPKFKIKKIPTPLQINLQMGERERMEQVAVTQLKLLENLGLEIQSMNKALSQKPSIPTAEAVKKKLKKYRRRYNKLKANIQYLDPQGKAQEQVQEILKEIRERPALQWMQKARQSLQPRTSSQIQL